MVRTLQVLDRAVVGTLPYSNAKGYAPAITYR
jgi:hypothetical protein